MISRYILFFFALASIVLGAKLEVTRAVVQQYEDGPPVFHPDTFTGGEAVHFSFLVEGFSKKEDKVHLTYEAKPADPAGVPLVPLVTGKLETALTAEDKEWMPKLRGNFTLPATLVAGEYSITVRLKDEIAGAVAEKKIAFSIGGAKMTPSSELAVRDLDFFRNEDDRKPLATPAFRVNEEIHVKFRIVGFHHDERGAMQVGYGVSIADSSGRMLLEEPAAAQDENTDFYPKPYVPGVLALTLKPGTSVGDYTLTIAAHDEVGKQQAEAHRAFRIE